MTSTEIDRGVWSRAPRGVAAACAVAWLAGCAGPSPVGGSREPSPGAQREGEHGEWISGWIRCIDRPIVDESVDIVSSDKVESVGDEGVNILATREGPESRMRHAFSLAGADGRFRVGPLDPNGRYVVTASDSIAGSWDLAAGVRPGMSGLELRLRSGFVARFVLELPVGIGFGPVEVPVSVSPVGGDRRFWIPAVEAVSTPEGMFATSPLPPGEYEANFGGQTSGFQSRRVRFVLPDDRGDIRVRLQQGVVLSGRVEPSWGRGWIVQRVTAERVTGGQERHEGGWSPLGADGSFSIGSLGPGEVAIGILVRQVDGNGSATHQFDLGTRSSPAEDIVLRWTPPTWLPLN